MINYKLIFKYIFFYKNQIILQNHIKNEKNFLLFFNKKFLYYTVLHIKLSSLFYSTQLCDMFAYDNPTNITKTINNSHTFQKLNTTTVVYNFHNIFSHERFFFFINLIDKKLIKKNNQFLQLKSIFEMYPNSWWLEREISELNDVNFLGKKDTRNLMLPYGDTTYPFKKSFPSIGLKEIFYDSISDQLTYNPVSIQY